VDRPNGTLPCASVLIDFVEKAIAYQLTAQPDSGTVRRMRMMLENRLYRWMANPSEKRLLVNLISKEVWRRRRQADDSGETEA